MKLKKLIAALILVALIAGGIIGAVILNNRNKGDRREIIATNFIAYDFARAITGDSSAVKLLLKPGAEAHDFEPSPQDIKDIVDADFFIYTGGESDKWVDGIVKDNNIDTTKIIKMMDFVELKEEEVVEGMEDEHGEHEEGGEEYDEHIWTSPINAIRIIQAMRDRFIAKNPAKDSNYTNNANRYIESLKSIDNEFRDIVKNAKRKNLVFGDRFPFRYFADEYGLSYAAAFPGCSDQTEASSSTISYLINKIKSERIPVVLKIELTNGKLAQTIADETGAKILTLNAAHNISQEQFDKGTTYADIMKENLSVLREALN